MPACRATTSSSERGEQALADAELIALRAQVHPRTLVDREPQGMRIAPWPHEALLDLGEVQAAKFKRSSEAWRAYHATLARALVQYEVGYFIFTYDSPEFVDRDGRGGPDELEFEPCAYAVDLGRWEPRDDFRDLLDAPPEHGVRTIGRKPAPEDFKPGHPWWLRRLRAFVDARERRRRRRYVIADPPDAREQGQRSQRFSELP